MMSDKGKIYDLEERTFELAKNIRLFVKNLPQRISNQEDIRQLVRSSGSIGANYIEANESFSKKDFVYRIKISRKEAKESKYWLKLIIESNNLKKNKTANILLKEIEELRKILSSIIKNTSIQKQ